MITVTEGSLLYHAVPYKEDLKSPDYYVAFWEWRSFGGEEARYHIGYTLSGCSSVAEAIEWEKENANGRESATLLPVRDSDGDCENLYLLHGSYPEGEEIDPGGDFGWTLKKVN